MTREADEERTRKEAEEGAARSEKRRKDQEGKFPYDVEGEGREAAADQDVGPESTPSRGDKG